MFFEDCTCLYAALANYNSREGIMLVLHFPSQIHSVITDANSNANSKSWGPPPLYPAPTPRVRADFFDFFPLSPEQQHQALLQNDFLVQNVDPCFTTFFLCQKRDFWSWMLILALLHFFSVRKRFFGPECWFLLYSIFSLSEEDFLVLNVGSCFIPLLSQGSIGGPELSVTWFLAVNHLVLSCQSLGPELSVTWSWAVSHMVLSCQSLGPELSVTWFWAVSHLVLSCQSLGPELSITWSSFCHRYCISVWGRQKNACYSCPTLKQWQQSEIQAVDWLNKVLKAANDVELLGAGMAQW